ncbi:carboxylating nicotinate-nucleotide diphosphorylase [Listeria costaricensis]|uniref:carboxylating nicotinate-nucleotide diphosphorylase n=1 Tax=Listeria costaricensis TaxID=2026604 RepID=UPI000C08C4FA|nr:carboxylating nicotinate-nucleotide diphosphorylase [Listeria costaricensis]
MNPLLVKQKLATFLTEDIQQEDLSASAIFTDRQQGTGVFIAKATGILAGVDLAEVAYELLGGQVSVTKIKQDGDQVEPLDELLTVRGPVRTLLSAERVILNLMQRMSGIATLTSQAVKTLDDPAIRITDTRKTAPGLRMFDKYAVSVGGGTNHRFGLYDGIMLKDNHIAFAGGIREAVKAARLAAGQMVKIEVEVETKAQLLEAIAAEADIIMFDNRTPEEIKSWQPLVPASIQTEISGGITMRNLPSYRGTGADSLSLGFLTHSVQALDISFNYKGEK